MTLSLPAILDTPAAADLRDALRARIATGEGVLLNGAAVEQAGLACLQLLVAAKAAAAAGGQRFAIDAAAPPLREMASLAGLSALFDPA
jgi:chemotaxis protein CheX